MTESHSRRGSCGRSINIYLRWTSGMYGIMHGIPYKIFSFDCSSATGLTLSFDAISTTESQVSVYGISGGWMGGADGGA